MFDQKHYVPLLKAKQGELNALAELNQSVKDGVTPLLELPLAPWDWNNDQPAKSIDEHLDGYPAKLTKAWGANDPFFVDTIYVDDEGPLASGAAPVTGLFDSMRNAGLRAIPVTGPSRDAAQQQAVGQIVAQDSRGVCIRLQGDDLGDPLSLTAELTKLLGQLGCELGDADLVLDYEQIDDDKVSPISVAATAVLTLLTTLKDWRTVTLASGGFPVNLQDQSPISVSTIPRADWRMWGRLIPHRAKLGRMPTFGDYGIASPQLVELDPRIIDMSVNLRYASDDDWLALKARSRKKHGHGQFNDLCQMLVARTEFRGASFSAGDNYIADCAAGTDGPGNATKWRQCGTSHHLAHVVRQIAVTPGL